MISIRINGKERQYSEGIEPWINEQINRRRQGGGAISVEVSINMAPLNMLLRTPGSVSGNTSGAYRPPTSAEQRIFDLWDKLGLNDFAFTGGQVVAFLKQLRRNT